MITSILKNKEVTNHQFEQFQAIGFTCYNDSGDYTDLELDVTYQEKEENGDDRYSFNLHLTFNWEYGTFYMVLGTNLGDGWNEYHQANYIENKCLSVAITETLKNIQKDSVNDEYVLLTQQFNTAHSDILNGAKKLSRLLGLTS